MKVKKTTKSEDNQEIKNNKPKNIDEHKLRSITLNFSDVKEMSKNEIIEILRDELRKKDKEIQELQKEKEILFKLSIKRTKKRLEEEELFKKEE